MKKKFLFITIFILVSSTFVKAQDIIIGNNNGTMNISYDISEKVGNTSYSDVKGSPYTSIEFQEATKSGIDAILLVRYDAYKQILLFKDQSGNLKVANPLNGYRFDLKGKDCSYVAVNFPEDGLGYGLLLWENSNGMRLIKKQVIKYNKGKEAYAGYGSATPASFGNVTETFFIQLKENGSLLEVPSQKKQAFKLLGSDFENNAKKNKLNIKDEEEFIKLLKLTFSDPK